MGESDFKAEELLEYLERELKSATGKLYELLQLLDRSWTDPGAAPIKKAIARHTETIEEISQNLRKEKPFTDGGYPVVPGTTYINDENEMQLSLWDGNGMILFRDGLAESRDQFRRIAAQCNETVEKVQDPGERADLEALLRILRKTEGMESAVIDSVSRIDRIYRATENAIADYFDLAVQMVPPTELGTSTFEHLSGHEEQMPFE